MRIRRLIAAAGVAALVAAGCAPPEPAAGPNPDLAPQANAAAYTTPGPFAVGVATLPLLGDRQVEIWYPASPGSVGDRAPDIYFLRDFLGAEFQALLPPEINPPFVTDAYRELPAATGSFPLVLFSHGAASYRLQSTFLTTHLASWGFVVMSPDFLERGLQVFGGSAPSPPTSNDTVLSASVDLAKVLNAQPGGALQGRIDTSRIVPIGHSAGGGASTNFARRPEISSWISMSGGNATPLFNPLPPAPKSAMWMVGYNDQIASPDSVRIAYEWTPGEGKFVGIGGAGHNNAFTDICTIGGGGGPVGIGIEAGLPIPEFLARLGNDGCLAPNKPSEDLWPIVRHFVTAELKYRAGLDEQPVGLGTGVTAAFPNDQVVYRHDP